MVTSVMGHLMKLFLFCTLAFGISKKCITTIVICKSDVLSLKYSFKAVVEVISIISEFFALVCIMTAFLIWCLNVTDGCNIQDNDTCVNLCVRLFSSLYFSFLEPCHQKWVK